MPILAANVLGQLTAPCLPLSAACAVFPGRTDPEYSEGMQLAPNYPHRAGYQRPPHAEMEFASRAGAATARFYGETEELFAQYAWYQKNSAERTWPVGSLMPNDFGLFDVNGNVFTWCLDI